MYKIIANWKMYLTIAESRNLSAHLAKWWKKDDCSHAELVLLPSTLAVHDVQQQLANSGIQLGIQEIAMSHQQGAFTGQNAAQQVKELGLTYCLVGHSEMRQFYALADKQVHQQVQVALSEKLIPIICIGETQEERDHGRTDQVITSQLHTIFSEIDLQDRQVLIAYEPRWAIGSGKPVDPQEAERVHNLIRHTMKEFVQSEKGMIQILYGGSVNAENIKDFLDQPNVDGALIGSASAKLDSLKELVETLKSDVC